MVRNELSWEMYPTFARRKDRYARASGSVRQSQEVFHVKTGMCRSITRDGFSVHADFLESDFLSQNGPTLQSGNHGNERRIVMPLNYRTKKEALRVLHGPPWSGGLLMRLRLNCMFSNVISALFPWLLPLSKIHTHAKTHTFSLTHSHKLRHKHTHKNTHTFSYKN